MPTSTVYCAIQGGNLTKTITTDLGTEELKAFDSAALAPYMQMSKEELIALYGKGEKKFELSYTDTFYATTVASRATGKRGIGGLFECKDLSGAKLFSAYQTTGVKMPGSHDTIPPEFWIVEHKQEPMLDNVRFNTKVHGGFLGETREGLSTMVKSELNAKFPTYESYFDDWNNGFLDKNNKQKLNSNYRMTNSFSFDVGFWLNESMGQLSEVQYFCEAKKGTFMKDAQPFRSFMKDFYMKGGASQVSNVVNGQYILTSPFIGKYTCVGGSDPFKMELDSFKKIDGIASSFGLNYALIKKGMPGQTVQQPVVPMQNTSNVQAQPVTPVQAPSATQNKMAMAQQTLAGMFGGYQGEGNVPTQSSRKEALFAKMGYDMADMNLVANAIATKAPFGTQQGANVSTALYNGQDTQGCDLVSIEKSVANVPNSKRVFNYKSCNGQIISLGETGLPGVPRTKELDPIIAQVKSQCKAYGAYGSEYQGTIISCRSLDQNHCNLEINIMQNGKLIDKRVENTCK